MIWEWNSQGGGGGLWVGVNLNSMGQVFPYDPAPAIQLNSSAVPEPHSTILCGLMFIGLMIQRPRLFRY